MLNLATGKIEKEGEEGNNLVRHSSISERPRRHKDPTEEDEASLQSPGSWRAKRKDVVQQKAPGGSVNLADIAGVVNRLGDEGGRVRGQSLSPAAIMTASSPVSKIEPVLDPPHALLQKYLAVNDDLRYYNAPVQRRPHMVAIRRYKMTLVGAGEAGKTSLRKCFATNPLFFKNLPEVGTTTGIDAQRHRVKVGGDSLIDIEINDFAGQEIYHSHSLFLTNRTLFIFVWNMSGVEQTFEDYGISEKEEQRLKQWADVVQAKCPGAQMVVIGTHKDVLRDSSRKTVVLILNKVCKLISDYIETFRPESGVKNIFVGGSFCVSCKDRSVIPENHGGPTKVKDLFQWLAELCHKCSKTDLQFGQDGKVPRYVVSLIATIHKLHQEQETLLLPMKAYNTIAKQLGIPKELLHKVTTMLHDWGVIYLFDRQASKLGRQDCVFLHPLWLSCMVSAVFAYAHACTAPDYERATMEVPLIDINACDATEPTRLILEGVITTNLARVLFSRVLRQLKREPTEQNIDMCFTMLCNLDLLYKNTYTTEVGPLTHAYKDKTLPPSPQYYVPSIFPRNVPADMGVHISRLMRNRGNHTSFTLTPFPKEVMQMLHCRVHPMVMRLNVNAPCPFSDPPQRKVHNNWRDGMWLAGGGGMGQDLGLGPLRALAVADMEGRRIDVWAVSPNEDDQRMMSTKELSRHFGDALKDLTFKFPGISFEEREVRDPTGNTLEDETFTVLTSAMKPAEVKFLAMSLNFDLTKNQEEKLNAIDEASSEAPQSPTGQMKVSLLLDKLVRACMLQDTSISTMPHSKQNRDSVNSNY
eukprot:TRINITY_DN27302_c0_g1_i1.p1 TRINITY_DN27302_c0_g1~~TRINITY_DN27302_c0_g1_i1.p1  ORF type:complete len:831 (+),score=188.39 TRINITY_DN27302_c0_g1_i1:67-2493(+)